MEMLPRLYIFALCLSLFGCGGSDQSDENLNKFAQQFIEANQAATVGPMLELYELEGSTEKTKGMLQNALLFELGMPIKSIDFEALSGDPVETIAFEHQGTQYGPTLQPKLRMRVSYATEDRFESLFIIGQRSDGEWRIISSRPIN